MTQQKEATIGNGAAIIERFGGIRPMASKINVPVTTVQGWKKRDAIPAGRMEQIMQAARDHSVDISDILSAPPPIANENDKTAFADELKAETERTAHVAKPAEFDTRPAAATRVSGPMPNVVYEDFSKQISESENKAVTKSAIINVMFLLITTAAVVLLLWPQSPVGKKAMSFLALEQDVTQLKGEVEDVRKEQSTLETMIPADVRQQISQLQQQVQVAAADVTGPDAGTLEQRIAKLEEHVGTIAAGSPALAGLIERYQSMRASPEGAGMLSTAWTELSNFVASYQGAPEEMGPQLENAKAGSPGLAAALEGVPPQDMKAAAMLFAMAQVRAMLDRENVPVQNDLQILKSLAGTEDPELNAALDRLVPLAADRGVMTPAGLTNQFESIATEVVTASLRGEDVSLKERATAHLNEVLQVEKDGTLITGTPAQATVQQSRTMLQSGDLMGAIATMQRLEGPAAAAAAPWLQNANATLAAQQLKSTLTRVINLKAYGGTGGITAADAPLMTNPASLYKPLNVVQ